MQSWPHFLMTDPSNFEVCYEINPWMKPAAWGKERFNAALTASAALRTALEGAGAEVDMVAAVPGLPDLVFPANAAVVLDGKVLLARFRHKERQGEEEVFRSTFEALKERGLIEEIFELADGDFHEGAGDAIWDAGRRLFWAGFGPRSSRSALKTLERTFGQKVVPLELASDRFYHLDTCFCPLSGGQVLYFPDAFTPEALRTVRDRLPEAMRIEASADEAAAFCVNAVNLGETLIMACAPPSLRTKLESRGYRLVEIDLSPFMLSGGASYCMTLRLDRTTRSQPAVLAAA